jgi:hypothetical protein
LSIHKRDTSGTLLLTSSWFVTTTTTNTKIIPALTKSPEGVGDSEEDEAATTICKATAVRKRLTTPVVLWVRAQVIGGVDTGAVYDSVRHVGRLGYCAIRYG